MGVRRRERREGGKKGRRDGGRGEGREGRKEKTVYKASCGSTKI